jgi:hypothetical protein
VGRGGNCPLLPLCGSATAYLSYKDSSVKGKLSKYFNQLDNTDACDAKLVEAKSTSSKRRYTRQKAEYY